VRKLLELPEQLVRCPECKRTFYSDGVEQQCPYCDHEFKVNTHVKKRPTASVKARKLLQDAEKHLDKLQMCESILKQLYRENGDGCIERTRKHIEKEISDIQSYADRLRSVVETNK
jgi:methionyl-tRNA synthetase